MNDLATIGFIVIYLLAVFIMIRQQRTIERQNDTIQRLANREPVTYPDAVPTPHTRPQKPDRTVYAAWGNQMVNMDEEQQGGDT